MEKPHLQKARRAVLPAQSIDPIKPVGAPRDLRTSNGRIAPILLKNSGIAARADR